MGRQKLSVVFLIPCLLLEPLTAACLSGAFSAPSQMRDLSGRACLGDQALTGRLLNFLTTGARSQAAEAYRNGRRLARRRPFAWPPVPQLVIRPGSVDAATGEVRGRFTLPDPIGFLIALASMINDNAENNGDTGRRPSPPAGLLPPLDDHLRMMLGRLKAGTAVERSAFCVIVAPWLEHPSLRSTVERWLWDSSPRVKAAALLALSRFIVTEPDLRWHYKEGLISRSEEVRLAAVTSLTPFVAEDASLDDLLLMLLADESVEIRFAVVQALSPRMPSSPLIRTAFIKCLIKGPQRTTDSLQKAIVSALIPTATSSDLLEWIAVDTPNRDFRRYLIPALSRFTDEPAVRAELENGLFDRFGDGERVTPSAIPILLRGAATIPELLYWLHVPGLSARLRVIKALAPAVRFNRTLRNAFKEILLFTKYTSERRQLLAALIPGAAVDEIYGWLTSEDWDVEGVAIEALADEAKSNPSVRAKIWNWMHQDFDRWDVGISALIASATVDELQDWMGYLFISPSTRSQVLDALLTFLSRSQVIPWLESSDPLVRTSAIRALGTLRVEDPARSLVLSCIHGTRGESIVAIKALLATATYEELVEMYKVRDVDTKVQIIYGMARIAVDDPRAVAFLVKCIGAEGDFRLLGALQTAVIPLFAEFSVREAIQIRMQNEADYSTENYYEAFVLRRAIYGPRASIAEIWRDSRRFTTHTVQDHEWLGFLHALSHQDFLHWVTEPAASERVPMMHSQAKTLETNLVDAGVITVGGPEVRWAGRSLVVPDATGPGGSFYKIARTGESIQDLHIEADLLNEDLSENHAAQVIHAVLDGAPVAGAPAGWLNAGRFVMLRYHVADLGTALSYPPDWKPASFHELLNWQNRLVQKLGHLARQG